MISGLDVYRPGTGWLVPLQDKLTLMAGDILRVSVAVPYRGPEAEFTLYGSIGQRGLLASMKYSAPGRRYPALIRRRHTPR